MVIGKILNDTATVSSLNIKEKDFLVVMVSKVNSTQCKGKAKAVSLAKSFCYTRISIVTTRIHTRCYSSTS